MNSHPTLYFPGTALNRPSRFPIFLLFQNIHVLAPVESGPSEGGKNSPDSFIKSGFCQVHTPCPLGKDRNRFLRLVQDISTRTDDYAAQLSTLTLAAMAGGPPRGEESERSIARSLFAVPEQPIVGENREWVEKLWQARLLLAIGELLDREEEDISANLALLEEEEKSLFKELMGDEDKDDEDNFFAEFTRRQSSAKSISPGNVRKRFQAWRTLFLAAESEEYPVFLAGDAGSGDLLLDLYHQQTGQQAPLVARFALPSIIGLNEAEAGKIITDFVNTNASLLEAIKIRLGELLHQTATPEWQSEYTSQWEEAVAASFPEEPVGRTSVSIYLFPGTPCSTLMGKMVDRKISPDNANGLLAVID